jgi:formiminoglutamate deiminase
VDAPVVTAAGGRAYWCELAWLGGTAPVPGVLLQVAADRIGTVARAVGPPPGAHVLRGLTLPGAANAHSHAFHRALRGRTHEQGGTFWSWRDQMYAVADRLDPDTYRELATAVFAEMVQCGYTCVGEFHYLHHGPGGVRYTDDNAMGRALIDAAIAAGIRLTLLDACYLAGGFGAPVAGPQLRFSDGAADRWASRVDNLAGAAGPLTRIGAAVHSVRAVPEAAIGEVVAWATGANVPLHAHVAEQPAEHDACLAATGRTPVALLADHGALGPRFTAVHATHVTADDIELLAGRRCTCCVCPTTERDLGDGIGPTAALAAAGAALALGSDSHAVVDPFEEARAMELDARLDARRRGIHTPVELATALTAAGYRCLGWPDGGALAPGRLADLVTVALDGVRLAGTAPAAALSATVFAANAGDVTDVIIGGRHVVSGGRHRTVDVARALSTSIAAAWAEPASRTSPR